MEINFLFLGLLLCAVIPLRAEQESVLFDYVECNYNSIDQINHELKSSLVADAILGKVASHDSNTFSISGSLPKSELGLPINLSVMLELKGLGGERDVKLKNYVALRLGGM